jgi:hypothetical protein
MNLEDNEEYLHMVISEYLPKMAPGKPYTVEDIFQENWGKMDKGLRIQIGKAVSRLVAVGHLKLIEVDKKVKGNTKTYMLK